MGSIVSRAASKEDSSSLAHIPEEIIKTEILTRLPVLSIIRLRCVCKSWNSLLSSDPDFVQAHLTNYSMNLDNPGSLIVRCFPLSNPNKIHPLNSRDVQFGGSVNGLVCVYSHNLSKDIFDFVGLWNPATNLYKDIPIPPYAPIQGFHISLCSLRNMHTNNSNKRVQKNPTENVNEEKANFCISK